MKKTKKRLEQKVEETPITEETTQMIQEEKPEKKPIPNINNPIGKWRLSRFEITKWRNVDQNTGNEWFNFLIKAGRKNKETGEWKNDEFRLSESEFVSFKDLLCNIAQENLKARTERK